MAFICKLSSPEGAHFNGEVWQVSLPSVRGEFCLRTGHIPVVTVLEKGVLEIAKSEHERLRYSVESGIAVHDSSGGCRIIGEQVTRLTES